MKKLGKFLKEHGLNLIGDIATGNIGGAIDEVLEGIGIKKGTSEEEIIEKLKQDKELMYKMKDLELRETQLVLEDKANARQREIDINNSDASWLNKNINSIIALTFMWSYLYFTDYVIKSGVDSQALTEVKVLFAMMVSYYFGSMKTKGGA